MWLVWPGPERRATGRVPGGARPHVETIFSVACSLHPHSCWAGGRNPGGASGRGQQGRGTQAWFLDVLPAEAMDTQGVPQRLLGRSRTRAALGGTGEVGFQGGEEGRSGLGNSRDTDSVACPALQPAPTQPGTGHPSPPPREGPAPPSPETGYGVRGGARLGVDAATWVLPWHRRGSHG